jgi:aspartate aminotransferase
MNHLLSDRINNLTSQTLAMAALARELKAQGKDISLSLGEPDFNTQTLSKKQLKKRRKLQHLFSSRWIC